MVDSSGIALDAAADPVASILIVTTLAGSLVRGCLQQLTAIASEIPFETIVVLNGADTAEAERLTADASGVQVIRSDVNLGSAGGLNLARPFARGEYLVSLHDDARPEPGWLDALVRAAETDQDVGAVGSLVLNRDGTVQAAGWELLPDGSTRPPWTGDPPRRTAFTARRAVDYAPTCSLLVRASAWDRVGGIDERYAPAYYTDVDLALALRVRGMRVLCEPASVVEHWRGTSSSPRFAAFASRHNQQKLLDKWGEVVRGHVPGSGATLSLPEAEIPRQDWNSDPDVRERTQLARIVEVSGSFATSLQGELNETTIERDRAHTELAASRHQLQHTTEEANRTHADLHRTLADLEQTRAELADALAQLADVRSRLAALEARQPWLEWRADVLANVEAGGWWRLRGWLLPLLRVARSAQRAVSRRSLSRP